MILRRKYIYGLAPDYDAGIRNSDEVTIKSFSQAINQNGKINSSILWLILEENNIKSQEEMIEILSDFTDELHSMWVGIDVYYVPKKVLDDCKSFIDNDSRDPNDINKYVQSKYLLHEYTYDGVNQTLKFYRETDYPKLFGKSENDREKSK